MIKAFMKVLGKTYDKSIIICAGPPSRRWAADMD